MTRKEDLQRQLQEQEAKLLAFRAIEKPTAEDAKSANTVCDDIDRIQAELQTEERADKAIAGIRKPASEPAPRGQPGSENRGFSTFGEYLQAVAAAAMPRGGRLAKFSTGIYDKRLSWQDEELRSTGIEEATPSLGGFLVSKDYSNDLLAVTEASAIVYPKTRKMVLTTNSNGIKIPGIDETSRASHRWGGILGYWENEGASLTATKPKFRNVELNLNKLTGLVYVTDEMLEDSSILESVVRTGFEQEFAFQIDDKIIRGSGAGQPLGILNGPSLVSVTGASSASTIVRADVIGAYAQMWPASMGRAEWFANIDTVPQLMTMTLGDAPLWLPNNQLRDQPYATLMGKRINFIESCSSVGTVGDLILADFSQYITITKGGLKATGSIHVAFTTDETAFRFILRIDGQPAWHSALTPYKGTNTLSPFVTIATRT
jgi:HK97 family phage major capsid protein